MIAVRTWDHCETANSSWWSDPKVVPSNLARWRRTARCDDDRLGFVRIGQLHSRSHCSESV